MTPTEQQQRIDELLADRAVFGLTAEEETELASLRDDAINDVSDYEAIGALLTVSEIEVGEAMPESLASRIQSRALLEQPPAAQSAAMAKDPAPKHVRSTTQLSQSSVSGSLAGWLVSACLLVVAGFGWLRDTTEPEPPAPTVAELRENLLKSAEDTITVKWASNDDPAAKSPSGDVVWSKSKQVGFMRIAGLDANDPTVQQYQLWIIDGKRNAARPVDGGVFDIPAGASEVIIPIDAKLLVFEAKLFAVTIEKPGGVVVSDRERLPLLASVDA